MNDLKTSSGTLEIGEIHPAAHIAMRYVRSLQADLSIFKFKEAMASSALSGNRLAEVAIETLRRLEDGEVVSDRYLMGLGWLLWELNNA